MSPGADAVQCHSVMAPGRAHRGQGSPGPILSGGQNTRSEQCLAIRRLDDGSAGSHGAVATRELSNRSCLDVRSRPQLEGAT